MNASLIYRLCRKVYWMFKYPSINIGYTKWSGSEYYNLRNQLDIIQVSYVQSFIQCESIYQYYRCMMPVKMSEEESTVRDLLESGI